MKTRRVVPVLVLLAADVPVNKGQQTEVTENGKDFSHDGAVF